MLNLHAASPKGTFVPTFYRVGRKMKELSDTVTYEIDTSGAGGFPFKPGQFNMIYAFGAGEVPISISGDPASPGVLVHTIRAVGRVTAPLVALKRGAMLGIRGPFGSAWPMEEGRGKDVLIVAGGLGLAPLRPAILHALSNRADYGRFIVLYGARTPDHILYRREIETWRGALDAEVFVTVDRANVDFRGNVGTLPALFDNLQLNPAQTIAMVCGPEIMMRFCARAICAKGVAKTSVYLSIERSMKCGVGLCGHCQFGPTFACKDGPVMRYDHIESLLLIREI